MSYCYSINNYNGSDSSNVIHYSTHNEYDSDNNELTVESESFTNENKNNNTKINLQNNTTLITPKIALPIH